MKIWRPRFSLRSLLILTVLLTVPLAWYRAVEMENRRIQAAIEQAPSGSAVLIQSAAPKLTAAEAERRAWLPSDPFDLDWRSSVLPSLWSDPWDWSTFRFRPKQVQVDHALSAEDTTMVASLPYVTQLMLSAPEQGALFERPETCPHLRNLELQWDGWGPTLDRIAAQRRPIEQLALTQAKITDADLRGLAVWPKLWDLVVFEDETTAATGRGLEDCRHLKRLALLNVSATEEVVANFVTMTELESLNISVSKHATASRLTRLPPALKSRLPGLRELSLNGQPIQDDSLAVIAEFSALEYLDLSRTAITGEGLSSLAKLPRLRNLRLCECSMLGRELARWSGPPTLERLDLSGTPLTAADLAFLAKLPRLRQLNVTDCGLGDDAVPLLLAHPTLERVNSQQGNNFTPASEAALVKSGRLILRTPTY